MIRENPIFGNFLHNLIAEMQRAFFTDAPSQLISIRFGMFVEVSSSLSSVTYYVYRFSGQHSDYGRISPFPREAATSFETLPCATALAGDHC
jgi:hypothetical protein